MNSATFQIVKVSTLVDIPQNFPGHICYYTEDLSKYYIWRNSLLEEVFSLATGSYEPVIDPGTISQYWRGDKTWQTLDQAAVGLGLVENTALSTWVGSTNITTLGTISSGVWNGSEISDTYISSASTWNSKIGGSGTNNYVAKFTPDGTTIGDSQIQDDGTNLSIAIALDSLVKLKISGDQNTTSVINARQIRTSGTNTALAGTASGIGAQTNFGLDTYASGATNNYGGNAVGVGGTLAIGLFGVGSGGTTSIGLKGEASGGLVNYAIQLRDGTQGVTGRFLKNIDDGKANWASITAADVSGAVGVTTGTNNYVAKFTPNGTTIGNSLIQDDGTNISVNTTIDALYKFKAQTSNNDYALGGYNTKVGGVGAVGYSNGAGTQTGVAGIANSATATQNVGISGSAINGAIAIGIRGSASGASSLKYAAQLQDGTEQTGKFLKSIDDFGKTNWAFITASDVSGVEPTITAGTTSQYWRGDKTWQTLNTTAVAEGTSLYFTEARTIASILTGLNVTGGTVTSTDSILSAFGKLQNQLNAVASPMIYQGTWNASTNFPVLTSSTGTKGYVYRVTTSGSTNIDGTTDWKSGDFIVYNGATWDKWDSTDAVTSVNGYTGAVTLVKADVGLSNVENTALSTWAGSTNITTVGTIGSGTWQGTAIADTYISSAATWNAKQDALVSGVNIKTINTNSLLGSGNLTINESPIFLEYNLTDKTVWNNGQGNIVSNTSFGDGSLRVNTTGVGNTGIGTEALKDNTTGNTNTGIGAYALTRNTTGSGNTAAGNGALAVNTNGYANTAFGRSALTLSNSTNQTAVGSYALSSSTSGFDNTAVGSGALRDTTTGNNNTAVGTEALSQNTTSSFNSAFGRQALRDNTTGTGNSSFGAHSLWSTTTANNNSAFGVYALQLNITGSDNTAIGSNSLSNNLLGGNTAVGAFSGYYLANGTTSNTNSSNSLFLGANTKSGVASSSNEIVIGYNAIGNGSNTTTIGRQGTTTQTLLAGSLKINNIYTLPNIDGAPNQVLQTNGSGTVTWATVSGGGSGTVTSVGLSMPAAFTVSNSPVTSTGTLTVIGAGTTSDYIRGDGTLATFPTALPTANVKHSVKYAEALTKGQAVYVSGANGTNILVSKADNSAEATSSKTMGLVTTTGAANYQGEVITEGLLDGLNTSAATIGDAVWLGTAGNLIFWHYGLTTKPVAPAHLVFIGIVTRVSATVGEIFVKPQNGFEIDELHDVSVVGRANNTLLGYNSATSLHEFKTVETWLGYTPENVANKSTSTSLGTSDTLYPTQNAVKVYADNLLGNANALVYKGTIDCSTNPDYPASDAGYMYIASVAGKIGGASGTDVEVGDMIICNTDGTVSGNQATVGQYWNVIQKNIVGAVTGPASSVNNKVAVFDGTTGKVLKEGIITDNGTNVGIGSIALTEKLNVNGNVSLISSASTKINIESGAGVRTYLAADGAGTSFGSLSNHDVVFYRNNSEFARRTATGFGIGTTTPGANLEVYGVADSVALVKSAGNSYLKLSRGILAADAHISFDTITAQKHIIGLINNSDSLVVGGTEAAPVITISGSNVGIGTTATPGAKLDVQGDVKISTIANATTNTNKFLVSDSGIVKYRSSTELLSDIELSNVNNTSDANKPISTATQTALNLITDVNWLGDYNNGYTYSVGDGVMFNGASFRMYNYIGAAGYPPSAYPGNWKQITDYVSPNDIGLGNVDNTSDLNKPISTATQTALNLKMDTNSSIDAHNDVTITSPIVNQILQWNGSQWINASGSAVNAGPGVVYFLTDTPAGFGTYEYMSKTPDGLAEIQETVIVNNNTVLIHEYISDVAVNKTTIDAGIWEFNLFGYVDTLNANFVVDVYKRTTGGTETLLFSAETELISWTAVDLSSVTTVQQQFTCDATDKLVVKVSGKTTQTSNVTLKLAHSGTTHYSHIHTPLTVVHNDIAGLQGGATGEYYHLNSAANTKLLSWQSSGIPNADIQSASTWNSKIGGSGTANFISKFTASGTIGNSLIQDDGTGLSIGIASPYPGVRFYIASTGIAIVGSGNTYGVQGKGKEYGVWGESTSDEVGNHVGVYGSAGDIDGGGATYIGGRFVGGGANGANYSLWLQDNTQGVGKFLKSITSDGKANWATLTVADTGLALTTTGSSGAATLVGNTLNIPQYTGSSFFIPNFKADETYRGISLNNNSTTVVSEGGVVMSSSASTLAQSVASTNFATKQIRLRYYATSVVGGRYTGTRGSALLWYVHGGFRFVCDFNISDTSYSAGCQQFYGMGGVTTDLNYGSSSNILVSTLLNIVGVGSEVGDTNLQIFHNDGSGTATKVDLGVGFPANRTAGAISTTVYSIQLYNEPMSTDVKYEVINKETGGIAQGTVSTNLPLTSQGLNFFASRCMSVTSVTNTGQFDLMKLGVYSI